LNTRRLIRPARTAPALALAAGRCFAHEVATGITIGDARAATGAVVASVGSWSRLRRAAARHKDTYQKKIPAFHRRTMRQILPKMQDPRLKLQAFSVEIQGIGPQGGREPALMGSSASQKRRLGTSPATGSAIVADAAERPQVQYTAAVTTTDEVVVYVQKRLWMMRGKSLARN